MTKACVHIHVQASQKQRVNVGAATSFQGPPGPPGFSPDVTVSKTETGHRVTITDADGTETFDVADGLNGGLEAMTMQDLEEIMS